MPSYFAVVSEPERHVGYRLNSLDVQRLYIEEMELRLRDDG